MQIKAQEYNWLDEKLSENIVTEWGGGFVRIRNSKNSHKQRA